MSQERNVVNLCENCITALRSVIDSNISSEVSIPLNQKLFIMETALENFEINYIDFEEICNHLTNAIHISNNTGQTIYANQAYQNANKSDLDHCKTVQSIYDKNGSFKYTITIHHTEPQSINTTYLKKNNYDLKKSVQAFEKDIIRDAINQYGSKRKAAASLGVDHSTLIKKCQRYGI